MSFDERLIGTNAIALAMRLNKSYYTMPPHHYCELLKKFFMYSVPIGLKSNVLGQFTVCKLNEPIPVELEIITELAAYKIINEFNKKKSQYLAGSMDIQLNNKQLEVLRLIATGHPDKIIASEEGITLNTVKYHKKSLFKKLNVESSVQAVIKSLKLRFITLDEINC